MGPAEGTNRTQIPEAARRAHDEAVRRGESTYVDPETGYLVLTSTMLKDRGECCASGCRHCPYSPDEQRRAGRPGPYGGN
jgi:hypothetical protein